MKGAGVHGGACLGNSRVSLTDKVTCEVYTYVSQPHMQGKSFQAERRAKDRRMPAASKQDSSAGVSGESSSK